MSLEDDMREAVDQRLAARSEDASRRRDARRRRLAELSERRRHGLAARHRTKLARQAKWLVIASICDCDRVAITVMEHWKPGTEAADPGEMTATGPDWRTLVPYLARDLHRASGLPISGMCTVVYVRDPEQHWPLRNEVTDLVYATADAEAEAE